MSRTLLAVPLIGPPVEDALATLNEQNRLFDVAEIRIDLIAAFRDRTACEAAPDLRRLLTPRPCPVIVTNRPTRQGGSWSGDEARRLDLLAEADALGADYLDVELDALPQFRHRVGQASRLPEAGKMPAPHARLIVSYHNFQETPHDLPEIARQIEATEADIVKVVTLARSLADNLAVLRVLRAARKPTIALTMGEHGHVARILGPKFGAFLVFASAGAGRESAPGQVPARDLVDLYRFRETGPATRLYGVIANPVAHSMSPAIHNAAFRECGIDAVYLPFRVDDVAQFIPAYQELPMDGYSVTIPHKEAVIPLLDEVEPLARRIGAVNTIVRRDGRLLGSNTDWAAAVHAIESSLAAGASLRGKTALLLGAGGASRAIAFGLAAAGCRVFIANRTAERAVRLAADVGCESVGLADIGAVPYDILVNGTSVGMHPRIDATPLDPSLLRPGSPVFDSVYNPLETRLLREARKAGCRTVDGLAMFVNQAAAQFELWTGVPAPCDLMRSVVESRLRP